MLVTVHWKERSVKMCTYVRADATTDAWHPLRMYKHSNALMIPPILPKCKFKKREMQLKLSKIEGS